MWVTAEVLSGGVLGAEKAGQKRGRSKAAIRQSPSLSPILRAALTVKGAGLGDCGPPGLSAWDDTRLPA